jgi:hypothetical protein
MLELAPEIYAEVRRLCAVGDACAKERNWPQALASYWAAWDQLPQPQTEWEAATWILGAIGDVNFQCGDFVAGRDNLLKAMHCPKAVGNPFLHLRLGQCQFELGALDRAADELVRAHMGAGEAAFEFEDSKYLAFLATRAKGIAKPKRAWEFWR